MQLAKIAFHLERAAILRNGGFFGGPRPPGAGDGRQARIAWHEEEAARLFADGLARWGRRHPGTAKVARHYRRHRATGTGSGAHNLPPERRAEIARKRWETRRRNGR